MPRKKKEEIVPAVENAAEVTEAIAAETPVEAAGPAVETAAEAPAEKPKRGRRKKAETEGAEAAPAKKTATRKPRAKKAVEAAAETVKKTVARKPRKKAVVPNFVIQNAADQGITYEEIVEKVKAATMIEDVQSVDIYVKAEEGKAYFVINGEAAGSVDLF